MCSLNLKSPSVLSCQRFVPKAQDGIFKNSTPELLDLFDFRWFPSFYEQEITKNHQKRGKLLFWLMCIML